MLQVKPYAYTTENDESAKLQALQDKKFLKIKTTTNSSNELKNKLNSVNLKFNDSSKIFNLIY